MKINIHNTLTGKKELFEPSSVDLSTTPPTVTMYHCGPTVYSYAHIGNMRSYIFADTIRRTFQYAGFSVRQVINITDVGHLVSDNDDGEDKVEKAAKKEGSSASEITQKYTDAFYKDLQNLNIQTNGTIFPKATEHIAEQLSLIKQLEDKGLTYKISDGIYFDTSKFPGYGKLGNINIEGLKEGARVETNTEKKNHTDFALWKFSPTDERRQQEWPSPWGVGFPGWHIECSAMSIKYLGQPFDIHTGGIDHIPVHHNNEIAQSEGATGTPLARYWLHNNHITIDGQKISKSIGNTVYLSDFPEKNIDPLAFRYWLLTSHYSTLSNFTWEAQQASAQAYEKIISHLAKISNEVSNLESSENDGNGNEKNKTYIDPEYKEKFERFIGDDFNTAQAIALIWEIIKDENLNNIQKFSNIIFFDEVLGLDLKNQITKYSEKINIQSVVPEEIQALVNKREEARSNKDFSLADEIRQEIITLGYSLDDTSSGPIVKKI